MSIQVDARGLSCPQPVILARRAIDAGQFPIEVQVDSVTSRENVRRMAEKLGCHVQVEATGEEFKLELLEITQTKHSVTGLHQACAS